MAMRDRIGYYYEKMHEEKVRSLIKSFQGIYRYSCGCYGGYNHIIHNISYYSPRRHERILPSQIQKEGLICTFIYGSLSTMTIEIKGEIKAPVR